MKNLINKILNDPLKNTLDNSNLSEDEMFEVVESMVSLNKTLDKSKDKTKTFNRTTAAKYLRISDSSFRNKVLDGTLPKGVKVVGQGKVWFKEDLDNYLETYGNKKKSKNTHI